jgi:alpha-galactosidase
MVHAELADKGADLRGVVAADGSRALFVFTQVASASAYPPAAVTLPGLDDGRNYEITLTVPEQADRHGKDGLAWAREPVVLSGRMLRDAGVRPPVLLPEQVALLELVAR